MPFRQERVPGNTSRAESEGRAYLRDGRAPIPARESTSRVMSANRAKNTGPELALRRELARLGVRGYRLSPRDVPGRPDLVFRGAKLAVFVHGCYWHRCPRCRLPLPKTHTAWWLAKFERNCARDRAKELALRTAKWRVLTLWECKIEEDPALCGRKVARAVVAPTRLPRQLSSRHGH